MLNDGKIYVGLDGEEPVPFVGLQRRDLLDLGSASKAQTPVDPGIRRRRRLIGRNRPCLRRKRKRKQRHEDGFTSHGTISHSKL